MDEACRIDVWLWRARLCKTRGLAAQLAESGRIRLTRAGQQTRLDKASRTLRAGDELVFAVAGRLTAIRIEGLGVRRGPAAEARTLYQPIDGDPARLAGDVARDSAAPLTTRGPD